MKVDRRSLILLSVFALLAALVIADRSTQDDGADTVVQPVARSAAATARVAAPIASTVESTILPIAPRKGYGSSPDGFFSSVRPPPPPPPPTPVEPVAPPQPSTPTPPFAVIGKQLVAGKWEVFLAQGAASLIAHPGERLDADWQVVSIRPPVMELEYVPNKQRQTLAIGADFND